MAKKSNLKSVRLSDEIMEYINEFEGKGFNEKFENIIIYAMKTETERKKQLEELNKLINSRAKILNEINKELYTAEKRLQEFLDAIRPLKHIY